MIENNIKYPLSPGVLKSTVLEKDILKENISITYIFRGGSVLIHFGLIILMFNFLTLTDYTAWLIIACITSWIAFFDFGLSNRIKNRLVNFLTKKRVKTGRSFVANTYSIIGLIIGAVFIIFLILSRYINWHDFFNVNHLTNSQINKVVFLIFTFISLRLIFSLIGILLSKIELPIINDRINLISSVLSLAIIYILSLDLSGYQLYLSLLIYSAPLVLFFFSFSILFRSSLKSLDPSFQKKYWKSSN